jgi:methylphosphotriester-DNA--protein-cysteine methyltransferase
MDEQSSRTWTLLDARRQPYQSAAPGAFGGHRKSRIYGRLDCPGALRAIARGGYVTNRVFFLDEATAIAAGFRPCFACMRERYRTWKADPAAFSGNRETTPMAQTVDRTAKLIDRLNKARNEFVASYEGLTESQMLEPGVTGEWSVRDVIAHVTWWDEESIKHLPDVLEGRRIPKYSDLYGGIDAFNAKSTEARRELSLADVLRQFDERHKLLVDYVRSVPAEELSSESRFRRRLRLDTYGHYPEHTAQIRSWRERTGY